MTELTSAQRKQLRKLAHHLDPVVIVGVNGVTESLVNAVDHALQSHELIKVRFNEFKDEKKDLTAQIAEKTKSQIAGILGHVAILYREHEDPEERKIKLD